MDRGLAVTTARVRCGSGTVKTPPATAALLTAARGSPLRLTGLDAGLGFDVTLGFVCGRRFVSVVTASMIRIARLRLVGPLPVRIGLVRVDLVRIRLVRVRPIRVGLVRVGLIRA
ncbi:hypothetical protein [Streptomyces sp. ID05-39B]|uniref:hypothetical protein n=1 Tax=Streptomyces sp. ID05-39B TaxID=3028664 RepID=UPI0029C01E89|nr:hypothetical protein [Streptomyces sp. ID05-39B]